ncbi:Rpp14/Pop5 family protein [Fervidicoccus fontis]|uniref:Ribonuclease P protein component 2 n=1 Tax=Fervidicoccus fontis (strain DSM 19380 / JCM 18336 / VKM B-2539 / Kam940) TaxID=1163730 RepID=I0A2B1_FERFK|nr:Rpp14/Pop5 family protein [Fervidicoccus fontis]AFH43118.1 ribonuclease P protein subunit Rpp14 [Fervidicoccus fontis Kam940]
MGSFEYLAIAEAVAILLLSLGIFIIYIRFKKIERGLTTLNKKFSLISSLENWNKEEMVKKEAKVKRKKRYIVFSITSDADIDYSEIADSILTALGKIYGEPFISKSGYHFIVYYSDIKKGIVRVYREYADNIIAIFPFARRYAKKDFMIVPVKVCGTVKKAKKFLNKL